MFAVLDSVLGKNHVNGVMRRSARPLHCHGVILELHKVFLRLKQRRVSWVCCMFKEGDKPLCCCWYPDCPTMKRHMSCCDGMCIKLRNHAPFVVLDAPWLECSGFRCQTSSLDVKKVGLGDEMRRPRLKAKRNKLASLVIPAGGG